MILSHSTHSLEPLFPFDTKIMASSQHIEPPSNTLAHFQMKDHVPPGITIVKSDSLEEWQMDIKVLDDNPLYKDKTHRLKFTFSNKYPIGISTLSPPRFSRPLMSSNKS